MTWERRLFDLFEDPEQLTEGAALAAHDAEVAELARAEYSEVNLASRWHASTGRDVWVGPDPGEVIRSSKATAVRYERDRHRPGRDLADPQHPDQPARDGGGRPFWPPPGR